MKNKIIKSETTLFTITALVVMATFLCTSTDTFALNAGQEMGASAQRLHNLINGNVMHVIMVVGIAASVAMSFYKSSFVPVAVGVGAGVLYGFAQTWIDATFAICI